MRSSIAQATKLAVVRTSHFFFFLKDPPPTKISPLPLPAPLPIWAEAAGCAGRQVPVVIHNVVTAHNIIAPNGGNACSRRICDDVLGESQIVVRDTGKPVKR